MPILSHGNPLIDAHDREIISLLKPQSPLVSDCFGWINSFEISSLVLRTKHSFLHDGNFQMCFLT